MFGVLDQEWFDGNETTSLLQFYGFLVLTKGAKCLGLPRQIVVVHCSIGLLVF